MDRWVKLWDFLHKHESEIYDAAKSDPEFRVWLDRWEKIRAEFRPMAEAVCRKHAEKFAEWLELTEVEKKDFIMMCRRHLGWYARFR